MAEKEKKQEFTIAHILEGKIDLENHPLAENVKRAIADMAAKQPEAYQTLINRAAEKRREFFARQNTVQSMKIEEFKRLKEEQKRQEIIDKNVRILQDFMNTYRNPKVYQEIDLNQAGFFTPYQVTKNGVPIYDANAQVQRLVGVYASTRRRKRDNQIRIDTNILEDIKNSEVLPTVDGTLFFQGGTIWSQLDSPAWASAYSKFSVNAQEHLEQFASFHQAISDPTNPASFFTLDIETFGNKDTKELFHVTEIAARKFRYDATLGTHVEDELYSWLIKPTNPVKGQMLQLISAFEKNPYVFTTFSADVQRSLLDLMRYSTEIELNQGVQVTPAQFVKGINGEVNVIHSNILDLNELYRGKSINHQVLIENFQSYAKHMRSGLANLEKNGEETVKVIHRYNEMVSKNRNLFFVTFNGSVFDLPALQAFGEVIGESVETPLRHLDWLKLEQSVFADPFEMQRLFGRTDDVPYSEGPWSLEEHRRSLFNHLDEYQAVKNQAHIATFDIGKWGLGGVVLATKDKIMQQINEAESELITDPFRRRSSDLHFAKDPVKVGQTYFAINAVQNHSGAFNDFQAEVVDGDLRIVNPGFNRNVLDAESYYTITGLRKLPGDNRYALELLNEATGTYTYIIREGENARYQFAQFIQEHLRLADDMESGVRDGISATVLRDRARRRYEALLGMTQGYTKGFEAAKRIFDNVRIFNENFTGSLDELTPERKAELEKLMNFNSLIGGGFNKAEAEQFWEMLPRLRSEYPIFSKAIEEIEKAIPMPEGLEDWQKRDINMKRSLALRRVAQEIDFLTGGRPVEERTALPYERYILRFQDRIDGKERTINLRDVTTAYRDISNYIFAQNKEFDGSPEMQRKIAEERFLTLVTSLQDSGYLTPEQLNTVVSSYLDAEDPSPAIYGKTLANELANNLDILDRIEQEQTVVKSTSLAEREALKDLADDQINSVIERGIQFADSVMGYHISGQEFRLTDEMKKVFQELDVQNPVTKLMPNNEKAVTSLLNRVLNSEFSDGIGVAMTVSNDSRTVYLHLFSEYDTEQVLGQLDSGKVPTKSVRIAIPLINNGTMTYGHQVINARTTVIRQGDEFVKVSSVQKLADMFDDRTINSILSDIHQGNYDIAQWRADRTTRNAIQDLAGTNRHVGRENDTFIYKGNRGDIVKQSHIDVLPAMVHDLYNRGILTDEHLTDAAFVRNDRASRQLKTYIDTDALTPAGLDIIDRMKIQWMKDTFGEQVYLSAVKSEHAPGMVAMLDLSAAKPFGYLSMQTRDNAVQRENHVAFDEAMQRSFASINDGTYVQFNTLTTTPLERELNRLTPAADKPFVYLKTVFMTDEEIFERLEAMKATDEGRALLEKERILTETGEYNLARIPTVYEQQMIVNEEVARRMTIRQTKFFDIDETFQFAKALIDEETGQVRIGAMVKPGDIIAQKIVSGEVVDTIRYDGPVKGHIFMDQGRLGVMYTEQAHKIFVSYEKGTFAGGTGYSAEFLRELTGVEGVGVILNPDIAKHKDYDSIYEGHINKIVEKLNGNIDDAERQRIIQLVEQSEIGSQLGLRVLSPEESGTGRYVIEENIKARGTQVVDSNALKNLLEEIGVDMDYLIQPVAIANVSNYSETVGVDEQIGRVKYGPRELDMLRRWGMNEVADYIETQIRNQAIDIGALAQARGMMDALRSLVRSPEEVGFTPETPVLTVHDFRDLPEVDNNKALYRETILDSEYIQEKIGYDPYTSTQHGFWFELPKAEGFEVKLEGRTIDKIFIPFTKLEGKGNEVWKTDIQRLNEAIFRAAQRVEEAKLAGVGENERQRALSYAFDELQRAVESYGTQLQEDIFTSKGYVFENVLKGRLLNSSAGIAKVMSPVYANQLLEDEIVIISEADAEKLKVSEEFARAFGLSDDFIQEAEEITVADILRHTEATGKDFHIPDLRYPTFHEDAIQIAKLRMSADVKEGEHIVSPLVAYYLREDSDGDYNNIVIIDDIKAQQDLAKGYARQMEHHAEQIGHFSESLNRSMAAARQRLYEEIFKSEAVDRDLSSIGDIHTFDPRNSNVIMEESLSKFGKQLVGMASNLNYRYTKLAMEYFDMNTEEGRQAVEAIREFFEGKHGLEQKIISAKHGNNGIVYGHMNAAKELIEALQQRRWEDAIAYDRDYLDGMFAEKARMQEAIAAIQILERNISDERFRHGSYRVGLSSLGNVSLSETVDWLEGADPNLPQNHEALSELQGLLGIQREVAQTEAEVLTESTTSSSTPPPFIHTPSSESLRRDPIIRAAEEIADEAATEIHYAPRGIHQLGSMLESLFHSKIGVGIGIAGAIGVGALMLSNLTSADSLTPESRPHNADDIQEHHPSHSNTPTARVEMEGEGLNGLRISVRGQSPGHLDNDQIGELAQQALQHSGINGNINIRSQDDTTTIDQQWLQQQFAQLINNGYVNG